MVMEVPPASGPAEDEILATVGGDNATNIAVIDSNTLTAKTSARMAGAQNVVVTTPGGSATLAGGFTYIAPPTVASISSSAGPLAGGTSITITGNNFVSDNSTVYIGGVAATNIAIIDNNTLTANTPSGTAGAKNVVVATTGGTVTLAGAFTYIAPPAVTNVSPSAGPLAGGTAVTITGTNFIIDNTTVTIGGTAVTNVVVIDNNTLTANTPSGTAGVKNVVVTTIGGSETLVVGFTYIAPPAVTCISPYIGMITGGTAVTITGTNLTGATAVSFGGTSATGFTVNSNTQITATVPAGSTGVVDVTVTTVGGTSATNSADQFTYVDGANADITVILQGSGRPDTGWIVPLTVKFFTSGSDVLIGTPLYTFNLTTAKSDSAAVAKASGITPGSYDISAVTPTCLTNVKKGVVVTLPSTTLDLGTLLEGNAYKDNIINIADFGILAATYGKSTPDYDAQADFDGNGIVNIADFGLLAANYGKSAPVVVP